LPETSDAGGLGDIFKMPMTQVAEERVRAPHPAKINVTPTIAIHVAQSHTRTVFKNPILSDLHVGEGVGENNARLLGGQLGETGPFAGWHWQLNKSEPRAGLPVKIFVQAERG
jgi:hypothetical protein